MNDEIDVSLSEGQPNQAPKQRPTIQEPIKEEPQIDQEPQFKPSNDPNEWFKAIKWSKNPFILNILPELFVGYKYQSADLIRLIQERHKVILLVGPTGSGKTTLLEWLSESVDHNYDFLFIGKPPKKPEEFVDIFNEKYPRFWRRRIKNIYQIPNFLNKRLRSKHLVVLYDEAHESNMDVLEWLRVLSDQVENMSIVIAGLPVFEDHLSKLETLRKRIMAKIELVSLTKEETEQMIKKRIRNAGGAGDELNNLIDVIYDRSGGFPREIIKFCNDAINESMKTGRPLTKELLVNEIPKEELKVSLRFLDELSPTQREIVEMLVKPMTPGQIANNLNLEKYKSRQHAVRSMNNILKRLMEEGLVERVREERAFVYQLVPSIRNIVVKA
ncbi:MAG TPA: AAA family ATPase [Candidatus Aenigmarchaeota archaeon]|nr:AAA family ATPase [Candidatus Aenigmarchaeota archaeon]